jgi:hypothetical protein
MKKSLDKKTMYHISIKNHTSASVAVTLHASGIKELLNEIPYNFHSDG